MIITGGRDPIRSCVIDHALPQQTRNQWYVCNHHSNLPLHTSHPQLLEYHFQLIKEDHITSILQYIIPLLLISHLCMPLTCHTHLLLLLEASSLLLCRLAPPTKFVLFQHLIKCQWVSPAPPIPCSNFLLVGLITTR